MTFIITNHSSNWVYLFSASLILGHSAAVGVPQLGFILSLLAWRMCVGLERLLFVVGRFKISHFSSCELRNSHVLRKITFRLLGVHQVSIIVHMFPSIDAFTYLRLVLQCVRTHFDAPNCWGLWNLWELYIDVLILDQPKPIHQSFDIFVPHKNTLSKWKPNHWIAPPSRLMETISAIIFSGRKGPPIRLAPKWGLVACLIKA